MTLFSILFLSSLVFAPTTSADATAQLTDGPPRASFEIDMAHSAVRFKVRHLGIANVRGTFDSFAANLSMEPGDLSTLETRARIDVASVDTDNLQRDEHLRSADFFDTETHPHIRFNSTGVTDVSGDSFRLAGDLTIHGVTKPVVLDAKLLGSAQGPDGRQRIGLEATTTIDRRDFGLTWNNLTEAGGIIVGHDVEITLEIEGAQLGV